MHGNNRKPVVVLIHGLGDDGSAVWNQTIKKLEKNYFLVTLDLPGFGRSSKTNQLYSPENYAKLIHYLTKAYVKKPFHLVGHSMGGAISLRYAANYPDDVISLTLISAAGILHRLAYSKYLAALGLNPFSHYLNFKKNDVTTITGYILNTFDNYINLNLNQILESEFLRASVLLGQPSVISALALVAEDFSDITEKVKAPTALIWGKSDDVAPLRIGQVLDAVLENSSLYVINDTGHVPMRDRPEEFNRLLIQSLTLNSTKPHLRHKSGKTKKLVQCKNRRYITYKGRIDTLFINNCKDVYIENAQLNNLIIKNSRVYMENVDIVSANTALKVKGSTVEITAGTIEGLTAIRTQNSRLDIAGTTLIGKEKVISASNSTSNTAVFSLTSASNAKGQQAVLHGQFYLSTDKNLFDAARLKDML